MKVVFNELDQEFKLLNSKSHVLVSGKTIEAVINAAVDCFNLNVEDIKIDSALL